MTSLELGNLDTSKVTDMSNMFYNCYSLTSLNLNSFNKASLSSYSDMFFNLTNLKFCINNEVDEIKSQLSSYTELNCDELCSQDSTNKFIEEKNKCINNCFLDDTYILEYDNKCLQTCPESTYYNFEQTACLYEIPLGYYLNDTAHKTLDKCIIKCSNCTIDSVSNELCVSCNNVQNYYAKLNDDINENSYIDCYTGEQVGYFFDNINNIYKTCHPKCKACFGEGSNENHHCSECINFAYLLDDDGNCNEIPEIVTTIIVNPETTIPNADSTIIENLITTIIENPKTTIIENLVTTIIENPETTIIENPETTIFKEPESTIYENFRYNPIDSDLKIINSCNGSIYSYNIKSNLTKLKEAYNNVTFINFAGDNYDFLYEKFN